MDRKKRPATIKTAASYLIVKDIQIDKNNYKQCFNTFFQNSFKTCLPPVLGSETPLRPLSREIFLQCGSMPHRPHRMNALVV